MEGTTLLIGKGCDRFVLLPTTYAVNSHANAEEVFLENGL